IEAYNLGTGKGYSVLEVITAFEKATGQKVNHKIAPRRAGDIAKCYADPQKAKIELCWEASRDLTEMCADSWEFTINNIKK
ncbi:MAG: UDP-glucose 4-epimerase, partial [Syntrophomonas sp.]